MPGIVLCYWKLRGLAQSIRLLLEHCGVEYIERFYTPETASDWFAEKYDLGFDFPNLPYLIDGDKKMTQSNTIMMYLAKKHGLAGANDEEFLKIVEVDSALRDYRINLSKIAYSPDFEKLKSSFMPNFELAIKTIAKFLGEKTYLMGDKICYADFDLYESLDVYEHFEPNCLKSYPNLKRFKHTIEELPNIKKYMQSDRFIKWPLNGWSATFGGGLAPPATTA